MRTYRKELFPGVSTRRAFINTPQIEKCLRASGIREGLALCNTKHRQFIQNPDSFCGKAVYQNVMSAAQLNRFEAVLQISNKLYGSSAP